MAFKRSMLRYGDTPAPVTPFQKAAQRWDERIGSARIQARNWRLLAFGSLLLSLALATVLIFAAGVGTAVPYIVEIGPNGETRASGPAIKAYSPTDAQVAYHLARFVENVRSLSIDPIIVRQNWLAAYDFVSDRAAVTLSDYAREKDPFSRIGRETIAVQVVSVVRATESSFQVRWIERSYEGGAVKDTRRMTGLFSTVVKPPRTAEMIAKNPLGIYVHAFNWTADLAQEKTE
ncbi:MAG TPA: conjugal transfer protein TrbF [Hyphomicrobiales bacterium]|jgi:type IV secretion system protein VirB5